VRIGCSGWLYRHWRGAFYPQNLPVKRWFGHYAQAFDTVEINASFYRLPPADTFAAWARQAPPGFRYAVKANRFITQARKLKDCEEPVAVMLSRIRHLGATAGPVLYQLPPRFRANLERLEAFLGVLPLDLSHVFEFRDPSWHVPAVVALLERYGAGFVVHDLPGLATPRLATGPLAYVRFHGGEGKYWGRYDEAALAGWSAWIAEQARAGREVWAYFNNDIDAAAIADARALRRLVERTLAITADAALEEA
jgi:uncharacterized protein YecE (DUF72 family)